VSTERPSDTEDLRGQARSLRVLFEFGTNALLEDTEPSELALRVPSAIYPRPSGR
jgi:hypothetical protein